MRYTNLCLTVALLCCDYRRRERQARYNDQPVASSIVVSAKTDEPVPYCPYNGSSCLKNSDYTRLYQNIYNGTEATCCKLCDTEPTAMRCCSEIMPCEDDVTDDKTQDRVCIRTMSELYGIGVLAVATCPEQSEYDRHIKCAQRYTTFDRRDPTGGSYTVEAYDAMPVRDVTTDTLYRNIHCALCNGRVIANIKFWKLSVGCRYTSNLRLATDSNILNIIKREHDCYFMFENPDPDVIAETCSIAVAKCNVTGQLNIASYDPMVEHNCLNGDIQAVINNDVLYKNAYCLECNGVLMGGDGIGHFERPSFSMLLRIEKSKSSTHMSSCGGGLVFHRSKGQCVEARCSLLRQLRGNVCERTVPNPDRFAYRIGLRIIPQDRFQNHSQRAALNVETGYEIIPEIGKQIKQLLLSVFPSTISIVYEMLLVGDIEYSETFNFSELSQADLAYYDIQLKLVNPEPHDPEQKLTELIVSENDATLDIDQPNVSLQLKLLDVKLRFRQMSDPERLCSFTFIDFFPCLSDNLDESLSIENLTAVPIAGLDLHEDGDGFFTTPVVKERSILEYRNCPFVKVIRSEMEWVETEIGVEFCISHVDPVNTSKNGNGERWESSDSHRIPLKGSEYVYGESSEVIWMCLETHEKLFSSLSASFADCPHAGLVLNTLMFSICMCFTL